MNDKFNTAKTWNSGIGVVVVVGINTYHPRVIEANLADIHGWGLLEISPRRVDHLSIVHLVPCTTSTCKQRPSPNSCHVFIITITSAKSIGADIIEPIYGPSRRANNTEGRCIQKRRKGIRK
jgi:hypothetical protein